MQTDFSSFFSRLAALPPHDWQVDLARRETCDNRLICVPTGMGKTLGTLIGWLYHRVERSDERWPRRLVWCLPMRTLVEQTVEVAKRIASPLGIAVHTLMGGEEAQAWHLCPEENAVLIGTQDMLLSRALNRGYAAPRARWPMEFGLLNQDCLWVLDEVQLMDVGLATSAQLQQFRDEDRKKAIRPTYSWWMSATLQPDWLKSVDTGEMVDRIERDLLTVPRDDRGWTLWGGVSKPLTLVDFMDEIPLADFVAKEHAATEPVGERTTLVVVNTVKRAVAVYAQLKKNKHVSAKLWLAHSRFRPNERHQWRDKFLSRDSSRQADRIIVATQVVEAGVDISSTCLVTDLAPWPSLVQRFGRAARYGGRARVFVVNIAEEKKALPYAFSELESARDALKRLSDVSVLELEQFHAGLSPERRHTLYPYDPAFLLLRKEIEELFDTTPDLTGADLDISRFIRSGEERDCLVFWDAVEKGETPRPDRKPERDEICSVPVGDFRQFMQKAKDGQRDCWKWDYLDGKWVRATDKDIIPGQHYLVSDKSGGYSPEKGFGANEKDSVAIVLRSVGPSPAADADAAQDNEQLSVAEKWHTIAEHGAAVARVLAEIVSRTGGIPEPIVGVLDAAARWHDIGKAHPAFASLIEPDNEHPMGEIAKAPATAWRTGRPKYGISTETWFDARPGFRHELASALALLDFLRQTNPLHEALLGPWQALLSEPPPSTAEEVFPVQRLLSAMDGHSVNLLLYLVASHHGKVRVGLQATPSDQQHPVAYEGDAMPVRGIMEGDVIPPIALTLPNDAQARGPAATLTLEPAYIGLSARTGTSWTERCAELLSRHGPFALAWLEALIRAADCRASRELSYGDFK